MLLYSQMKHIVCRKGIQMSKAATEIGLTEKRFCVSKSKGCHPSVTLLKDVRAKGKTGWTTTELFSNLLASHALLLEQ